MVATAKLHASGSSHQYSNRLLSAYTATCQLSLEPLITAIPLKLIRTPSQQPLHPSSDAYLVTVTIVRVNGYGVQTEAFRWAYGWVNTYWLIIWVECCQFLEKSCWSKFFRLYSFEANCPNFINKSMIVSWCEGRTGFHLQPHNKHRTIFF